MNQDRFASCQACNQVMNRGTGCTLVSYDDFADGHLYKRIPFGEEIRYCDTSESVEAAMIRIIGPNWRDFDCGDCNCSVGQLHHVGCDLEECPRCHGQAIICGCAQKEEAVNG